eukprot:5926602-Pyramimonas_sp.AAC.1
MRLARPPGIRLPVHIVHPPTLQLQMQGARETERTTNQIIWIRQAERKESTEDGFEGGGCRG